MGAIRKAISSTVRKLRLYHATPHKFAPKALRGSKTGLSGPGIYSTPSRSMANHYGKHVHQFDVDEQRFVDVKTFDAHNRVHRNGAKTAAALHMKGYHGVKHGDVYAVWHRRDLKNHSVAKSALERFAKRLHHATNAKFAAGKIRPSRSGLYGPGIYSSPKAKTGIYGSNVHSFDVESEKKFVDRSAYDTHRAKFGGDHRKAIRSLSRKGYIGVKGNPEVGGVFSVWNRKHTSNHTASIGKARARRTPVFIGRRTASPARPSSDGALGPGLYTAPDRRIANAYTDTNPHAQTGVHPEGAHIERGVFRGKVATHRQLQNAHAKTRNIHAAHALLRRHGFSGIKHEGVGTILVIKPKAYRPAGRVRKGAPMKIDIAKSIEVAKTKGLIRGGSSKLRVRLRNGANARLLGSMTAGSMADHRTRVGRGMGSIAEQLRAKGKRIVRAEHYVASRNRASGLDMGTGRGRYGPTRRGVYKAKGMIRGGSSKVSSRLAKPLSQLHRRLDSGKLRLGDGQKGQRLERAVGYLSTRQHHAKLLRSIGGGRRWGVYKAKAKTLYVYRPVLNADAIIAWAKSQGFKQTLAPEDMHVTLAYSKTPMNWAKLYDDYRLEPNEQKSSSGDCCSPCAVSMSDGGQTQRTISGGVRELKPLGKDGAVVLAFESITLTERWADFRRAGATWSFPSFTPHITISYNSDGVNFDNVQPYAGDIVLGEECWEEITPGAQDNAIARQVETGVKKALANFEERLVAVEKAAAKKPEDQAA